MPAIPSNNALRLPNLVIRGFRGIEDLTIPRLGRVTLFAGKNGVGKTTLLDAVRLYAACGRGYFSRIFCAAAKSLLILETKTVTKCLYPIGKLYSMADTSQKIP